MKVKSKIMAMFAIMAFISMAIGCGSPNNNKISDDKIVTNPTAEAQDTSLTGQELFRRNCAGCHGVNREGKPPAFPALVYIKEKMNKEQIRTQIKNGKGLMISHAHIPDNEIDAIISYLYNEPEQKTTSENYSSADLGKSIVMSNCVGCHRLTVNDPPAPNVKTLCPLMEPSAFVGEKKLLTLNEFRLILKTGPCYMPSFDYMSENEKEAVWIYLRTLDEEFEKGK